MRAIVCWVFVTVRVGWWVVKDRRIAQTRALGNLSLNLAVASWSLGLVAPILELELARGAGGDGQWSYLIGAAFGVAFTVMGLYLIGKAEEASARP